MEQKMNEYCQLIVQLKTRKLNALFDTLYPPFPIQKHYWKRTSRGNVLRLVVNRPRTEKSASISTVAE